MAMDFLPIQASAVPCEHVFSSSAETDMKKQNHISPTLMEALQMLKYLLKKKQLNFTQGWTMCYSSQGLPSYVCTFGITVHMWCVCIVCHSPEYRDGPGMDSYLW
jgi:hypothetical protein